jgi:hypothetical protein
MVFLAVNGVGPLAEALVPGSKYTKHMNAALARVVEVMMLAAGVSQLTLVAVTYQQKPQSSILTMVYAAPLVSALQPLQQ